MEGKVLGQKGRAWLRLLYVKNHENKIDCGYSTEMKMLAMNREYWLQQQGIAFS